MYGRLQVHRSSPYSQHHSFDLERLGESALIRTTCMFFGTKGGAHHGIFQAWFSDMYPKRSRVGFFLRREDRTYRICDICFLEKAGKKRTCRCRLAYLEKSWRRAHIHDTAFFFWEKLERSTYVRLDCILEKSKRSAPDGSRYILEKRRSAHVHPSLDLWKRGGAHMSIPAWISGKKEEGFCDVRKRVREAGKGFICASPVQASWCARPK